MQAVEEKYKNFCIFAKDIINRVEEFRANDPTRPRLKKKEFIARQKSMDESMKVLNQGCIDFLATIKYSRTTQKMSLLDIEDMISDTLNIKKTEISIEAYARLRRYLEFFDRVANEIKT